MTHTIASLLLRSRIVNGHYFWLGAKHAKTRHGFVSHNGKNVYVHRLAFCLENNLSYKGKFLVCHSRDCNEPSCWRPEHMYKGTDSSNMKDAVALKTHVESRKTHCPRGHEYTTDNLTLTSLNGGKRVCLTCRRLRDKTRKRITINGHRYTVPGSRTL